MTSLYRCPACGAVVRNDSGSALVCMCEALPFGRDGGQFAPRFGVKRGQIGPPRPYFLEREHSMVEMEDDGRELAWEDDYTQDGHVWLG